MIFAGTRLEIFRFLKKKKKNTLKKSPEKTALSWTQTTRDRTKAV